MKKLKYLIIVLLSLFIVTSCSNDNNNETIDGNSNMVYEKVQKTHEINLRKNSISEENSKSITFDKSNYFQTSYSTGSFGEKNGIEYYRCYHENAKMMTKLLKTTNYVEGNINSSFYLTDKK